MIFLLVKGRIIIRHKVSKITNVQPCQRAVCLPLVILNNRFIPFRGLTHGLWATIGNLWQHGQERQIKNFVTWRYRFRFGQAGLFYSW